MIQLLLVVAAVVFVIWLVMTLIGAVLGGLIHLLWIVILVALAIWAFNRLTGRSRGRHRAL